MIAEHLAPAVWRLEAHIGHKPHDTVNITSTECQPWLDPRVKSSVYPVIRKKKTFSYHFIFMRRLILNVLKEIMVALEDYRSFKEPGMNAEWPHTHP